MKLNYHVTVINLNLIKRKKKKLKLQSLMLEFWPQNWMICWRMLTKKLTTHNRLSIFLCQFMNFFTLAFSGEMTNQLKMFDYWLLLVLWRYQPFLLSQSSFTDFLLDMGTRIAPPPLGWMVFHQMEFLRFRKKSFPILSFVALQNITCIM